MTANEAAEQLDQKYPHWDIYRAHNRSWVVKLGDDVITGDTIEGALRSAVQFIPTPKIPRRPKLYDASGFEAFKYHSGWDLRYGQTDFHCVSKTKKQALDLAEQIARNSTQDHQNWVSRYGVLVDTGEEGVDYRFRE